jgi:hypothetical protein
VTKKKKFCIIETWRADRKGGNMSEKKKKKKRERERERERELEILNVLKGWKVCIHVWIDR